MTTTNTRFGLLQYEEGDVVTFADGLIGFPNLHRFVLLNHKEDSPFRWLQSLDEESLAFLVCDPEAFVGGYTADVDPLAEQVLTMEPETPRFTYATANIPHGRPHDMTLNLAGPIVVNGETRQAKQLVIEDEAYTMRHRVFQPTETRLAA